MRNRVVTKGDIFGGVHVFDMVQAVLSPAEAELARWEKVAFAGTEALGGSFVDVEYLDPATGRWVSWSAKVTVPIGTGTGIRATVRNDTNVRLGLAVDFLYASPSDWAAGKYTLIDTGPFVGVDPGKTLISEDYRLTINEVGDYLLIFVLRGRT